MQTERQRGYWVQTLLDISLPVFSALAKGELRARMPVEAARDHQDERKKFTHLEALGRSLAGVGCWLDSTELSGEEEGKRKQLEVLVRRALQQACDPHSRDFMNFTEGTQPLVDSAFLAQGLLRSYRSIWGTLDSSTRSRIVDCLASTRSIKPLFNNWLLFSAMTEAFLCRTGETWDRMRVDYAIRQHNQWYKGDGAYGDGSFFRWDYYNSFVIHPMLLDILDVVSAVTDKWDAFHTTALLRAQRFAAVQERLIAPDGSFPPLGRSLTYRFGAFHLLSLLAYKKRLPPELHPAQVRCGLTAVIKRMFERTDAVFDTAGWLKVGFCGHQPSLGEPYISTGSLYLCLCAFLPLGLGPHEEFWSAPPEDWTSKRLWAGEDMPCDHALSDEKHPTLK